MCDRRYRLHNAACGLASFRLPGHRNIARTHCWEVTQCKHAQKTGLSARTIADNNKLPTRWPGDMSVNYKRKMPDRGRVSVAGRLAGMWGYIWQQPSS